jgi:urease accessory protein
MTMPNHFGKDSELYIRAGAVNGKTILEDSFFTAPYKIAKPFYNENRRLMNIMVMSASAGIMEGDCYRVNVKLGEAARTALLGQSYNKIHRMKAGNASQFNQFSLGTGAFFDYAPKPTIPFAGSNFQSLTECRMESGSSYLYSEILACGREKSGERFEFKTYKNCNKVYLEDDLIFMDNQVLSPEQQVLDGIGFFEGYTHQATLACFSEKIEDNLLDRFYEILQEIEGIDFGLTKIKKYGVLARILGSSSDFLERILAMLRDEIYNWTGKYYKEQSQKGF